MRAAAGFGDAGRVNAVTWFGHSTVLVDVDGTRLVTDPVLGARVAHLRRAEAVDTAALGRVDGIVVSHEHLDHLHLGSLTRIGREVAVVVPRGVGPTLVRRGFRDVREVTAGESVDFGSVRIDVVHAEHGTVRRFVRARSTAVGFVVRGSTDVYFAGDTDLFPAMAELAPLDVALLPVGGWGPRLPAGHLDPSRAAEALGLLRPALAVPIHWGTFRTPFADAADDRPGRVFAAAAAVKAPGVEVRILDFGRPLELPAHPDRTMPGAGAPGFLSDAPLPNGADGR
jgi:L-ascorbate metabolism protein UlaG (beta-lactamase superfamily)